MSQSFTVQRLADELGCALRLKEALAAYEDDSQLIATAIEGETDLHEAIRVIAEQVAQIEAMEEALKGRIDAMNERLRRFERASAALRALIGSTMDRAGIQKVTSPECTISMRAGCRNVQIIDDARLPREAFVPQEPKLSMTRLRELMEAGEVEGATWTNAAPSVAILRK